MLEKHSIFLNCLWLAGTWQLYAETTELAIATSRLVARRARKKTRWRTKKSIRAWSSYGVSGDSAISSSASYCSGGAELAVICDKRAGEAVRAVYFSEHLYVHAL